MNQARSEEEEKERKRDGKDKGQDGMMERKAAQQNKKPNCGTKTRPTKAQLRLKKKQGEELLTSSSHRM